jgi:hypothetical protein
MPASSKISLTIRWCCPVETTIGCTDSLARIARMIGTSLIASGRVPTTTGTTSRGVSWRGVSRCAGAAAGGVRTIAGPAAVGTDVESWSAASSSTRRARSTGEPLPASLNALPLVEYSIAELMAGDIRLGTVRYPLYRRVADGPHGGFRHSRSVLVPDAQGIACLVKRRPLSSGRGLA